MILEFLYAQARHGALITVYTEMREEQVRLTRVPQGDCSSPPNPLQCPGVSGPGDDLPDLWQMAGGLDDAQGREVK